MHRAKLLNRQPVPVRSDVFLRGLSPSTVGYLREAMEQGLTLSALDIVDGIAILRVIKETRKPAANVSSGC